MSRRRLKKKNPVRKAGMAPGSIVFTGEQKLDQVLKHCLVYNENSCKEIKYEDLKEIPKDATVWLDIRGIHDTKFIAELGERFELHPLLLEDIADVEQIPKVEDYPKTVYGAIKSLEKRPQDKEVQVEHISVLLMENMIISLQEDETDVFSGVRHRIVTGYGRIRKRPAGYLMYALLDEVIDRYYHILDQLQDETEDLEEDVFTNAGEDIKTRIHQLTKTATQIRKVVLPTRELTSKFIRLDHHHLDADTKVFARDLNDHIGHILGSLEMIKENLMSIQNVYISEISLRMNNVMKVLTIVSAIFIPLTFMAGIYGMNFKYIPELEMTYGYFYFWILMIVITLTLIWYFRRQKWL